MSRRPIVAHVVYALGTGGLENGVVNVVNDPDSSFRHVVVCLATGGPLQARLRPGTAVFTVGKRDGQDPRAVWRLVRLLQSIRPDIVHSRNWATFDTILAARLAGVRIVIHGEHGRDISDPEGRNRRRSRLRRLFSPLVTRFVTVSDDLRRWLLEDVGVGAAKVMTIHNGVDVERFAGVRRSEVRDALGLPVEAPVIGTVSRLDPVKDHAGLLRAFAATLPRHPEAILVVAGDGPCWEEIVALAGSLGLNDRVRLLGERRDIPQVLAALDLFVLPSIAEGLSNTVLEAMATGLPVVATRVGGNPELVEDGVTGRLVPVRDDQALVDAIVGYLDDPHLRALHGKASGERALRHFGIDRMRRQYEELYRGLLVSARRRP
jgi:sugar transferase (PEP-CTERM/EpsH1 system associated)